MSSSLIFVLWIAWFAGLIAVAVLRYRAVSRESRQTREAQPRHKIARQFMAPDYRDQLVAAGIVRPAPEPDTTPDPATSM